MKGAMPSSNKNLLRIDAIVPLRNYGPEQHAEAGCIRRCVHPSSLFSLSPSGRRQEEIDDDGHHRCADIEGFFAEGVP
jgi:hypothetical protein